MLGSAALTLPLVVEAAAFVFGAFALPQIKHSERRGLGFVLAPNQLVHAV